MWIQWIHRNRSPTAIKESNNKLFKQIKNPWWWSNFKQTYETCIKQQCQHKCWRKECNEGYHWAERMIKKEKQTSCANNFLTPRSLSRGVGQLKGGINLSILKMKEFCFNSPILFRHSLSVRLPTLFFLVSFLLFCFTAPPYRYKFSVIVSIQWQLGKSLQIILMKVIALLLLMLVYEEILAVSANCICFHVDCSSDSSTHLIYYWFCLL